MSHGTYILCGRLGGIGIREGVFTLLVYKVLACILLGNWRLFVLVCNKMDFKILILLKNMNFVLLNK